MRGARSWLHRVQGDATTRKSQQVSRSFCPVLAHVDDNHQPTLPPSSSSSSSLHALYPAPRPLSRARRQQGAHTLLLMTLLVCVLRLTSPPTPPLLLIKNSQEQDTKPAKHQNGHPPTNHAAPPRGPEAAQHPHHRYTRHGQDHHRPIYCGTSGEEAGREGEREDKRKGRGGHNVAFKMLDVQVHKI